MRPARRRDRQVMPSQACCVVQLWEAVSTLGLLLRTLSCSCTLEVLGRACIESLGPALWSEGSWNFREILERPGCVARGTPQLDVGMGGKVLGHSKQTKA